MCVCVDVYVCVVVRSLSAVPQTSACVCVCVGRCLCMSRRVQLHRSCSLIESVLCRRLRPAGECHRYLNVCMCVQMSMYVSHTHTYIRAAVGARSYQTSDACQASLETILCTVVYTYIHTYIYIYIYIFTHTHTHTNTYEQPSEPASTRPQMHARHL
jgi:hypothetical protein